MTPRADREPEDPEARAAFRAFVRAHHPDLGGDPEEFMAGLARFQRGAPRAERPETGEDGETRQDGEPVGRPRDRFDAPVTVVVSGKGVGRVVQKVQRWRRQRRQPPRVR